MQFAQQTSVKDQNFVVSCLRKTHDGDRSIDGMDVLSLSHVFT